MESSVKRDKTKVLFQVLTDVGGGSASVTLFPRGVSAWWVCRGKAVGLKGLGGARNSARGVPGRGQSPFSPNLESHGEREDKVTG